MQSLFSVHNLSFRYHPKRPYVLKNISFDVKKGTIYGLLGPSGAGKSTTQKLLIKLLKSFEGEILFEGQPIQALSSAFYERVGVGFEMPIHFNKLSGLENLKYFAALYKQKTDLEALLTRLGLFEARNQPVMQYSKGMKMRLNFARAVLHDPDILFLDEPTNGLDPSNARIIKDMIQELKARGKTIVISTHLMNDVEELCDEVSFISSGKLVESASPKSLKLKYGKRVLHVEYIADERIQSQSFSLDALGSNPSFLSLISKQKIVTMHSQETSLDHIFIEITGGKHD